MSLLTAFNWRHAVKRYTGASVPAEKIDYILEAIRLAPTSLGAQPFTAYVIQDAATLAKLQPIAYGQPWVTEAAAVIVFAAWKKWSAEDTEKTLNGLKETRGLTDDQLGPMPGYFKGLEGQATEQFFPWAAKQAYIALGFGLAAAAEQGVGSTPAEGFIPAGIDELLGLTEKGQGSVVIMGIGVGDAKTDYLEGAKKVRRAASELFVKI